MPDHVPLSAPESSGVPQFRSFGHAVLNAVVSIAVLSACVYGFYALGERQPPERRKVTKAGAASVAVEAVQNHSGPLIVKTNGVVVPFRDVKLAAEVSGRVIRQSANLRTGRRVTAGETLLTIDPANFELDIRRLQRQQAQGKAELAALDVSVTNTAELLKLEHSKLKLAESERQRQESLQQRKVATDTDVEAARRAELEARGAVVEIENSQRQLAAQRLLLLERQQLTAVELERAELDLTRTVIKAPINGVVVQSMVEEETFLTAGSPFAVIEDTSAVEVRTSLTVDEMYWLWNDSSAGNMVQQLTDGVAADSLALPAIPATVTFELGQRQYQWQAVLERIDGTGIDQQTRTIPCLFRVDRPDQVARPGHSPDDYANDGPRSLMRGMFVSLEIAATAHRPLYEVSELALRPGQRIWLVRDDAIHIVPVDVVSFADDRVVIDAAGLNSDDRVVVSPVQNIREGLPVAPVPQGGKEPIDPPPSKAAERAEPKPGTAPVTSDGQRSEPEASQVSA
ncbi:MAG: HlyD family efflux transporter periplasmic adaptor subunit [Planctomycetaceae bacterium]